MQLLEHLGLPLAHVALGDDVLEHDLVASDSALLSQALVVNV